MKKSSRFIAGVLFISLLIINLTFNNANSVELQNVEILMESAKADKDDGCKKDRGDCCKMYGVILDNCDEGPPNNCIGDENTGFDPVN